MMDDYKELIKRGHSWINNHHKQELNEPCCIIAEMSTAIETLLAERDALMDQIRGQCGLCKNRRDCMFSEQARRDCVTDKARSKWEWKGK